MLATELSLGFFAGRFFRVAVEGRLAGGNDADVASGFEELHDRLPCASELRPARFGLRVLLQAAELLAVKEEIHLAQAAFGRAVDRVILADKFDGVGLVHHGLAEDGKEGLCESHGEQYFSSARSGEKSREELQRLKPGSCCSVYVAVG